MRLDDAMRSGRAARGPGAKHRARAQPTGLLNRTGCRTNRAGRPRPQSRGQRGPERANGSLWEGLRGASDSARARPVPSPPAAPAWPDHRAGERGVKGPPPGARAARAEGPTLTAVRPRHNSARSWQESFVRMDVAEFLEDVSPSCQAISSLPLVTPAQSGSLSHSSHSSPSSRTALRRLPLGALLLPTSRVCSSIAATAATARRGSIDRA
jgi:hypothetical protein